MAPPKSKGRKARHNQPPPSSKVEPATQELNGPDALPESALPGEAYEFKVAVFFPEEECGTARHEREASPMLSRKPHQADQASASHRTLEILPVEIVNHILSYLAHPRSRLPGLTERQSTHDFPKSEQWELKKQEDLSTPPDTDRFAADLFAWTELRHPFNALATTSRCCRELVESYCAHLVKACNRFNLPFDRVEEYGTKSVYPDMSRIVYRRLYLQLAFRPCVFCGALLSSYPHVNYPNEHRMRLLLTCENCFYAQTLSWDETQRQYHIPDISTLSRNRVRGSENYEWVLRVDAEALALKLYKTRAFHDTESNLTKESCKICRWAGATKELEGVRPQ